MAHQRHEIQRVLPVRSPRTGDIMNAADQLRDLSRAVRRLSPDRRDPERYYIEKSEIAARLSALARKLERSSF
jgi:hypothetical protein